MAASRAASVCSHSVRRAIRSSAVRSNSLSPAASDACRSSRRRSSALSRSKVGLSCCSTSTATPPPPAFFSFLLRTFGSFGLVLRLLRLSAAVRPLPSRSKSSSRSNRRRRITTAAIGIAWWRSFTQCGVANTRVWAVMPPLSPPGWLPSPCLGQRTHHRRRRLHRLAPRRAAAGRRMEVSSSTISRPAKTRTSPACAIVRDFHLVVDSVLSQSVVSELVHRSTSSTTWPPPSACASSSSSRCTRW